MKLQNLLFPIIFFPLFLQGQGIYEAGLTVDGVTYYEGGYTFNGKNFSVSEGGNLYLTFAYVKTTKTGSQDVCSARINYCVYPASGTCSGFFVHGLPWSNNISCGDPCTQQWDSDGNALNINLANGLVAGSYKIAVYYDATVDDQGGCPSPFTAYFSNGGANYIANLTVTAPAAVGLSKFEAFRQEDQVELNWSTEVERNHAHFEIERSADMSQWTTIGKVVGNGDTDLRSNYGFIDSKPANGITYYRLRIVDNNNQFEYSPVVKVEARGAALWQISPNPVTHQLTLQVQTEDIPLQIRVRVFAASGIMAFESVLENTALIQIPFENLPQGVYAVEILDDVRTIERHLVFKR